jgi:hypothetical protein
MAVSSLRLIAIIGGGLFAGGCASLTVMSHVPLASLVRLIALDVSKLDTHELRVAARLPAGLEPRKRGVKVTLESWSENEKKTARTELVLAEASESSEMAPLAAEAISGMKIWAYKVDPHDFDRLERLRAEAAGHGHGSISVGVDACHRGPLPEGPLRSTTYLRVDASGYFKVVDDIDLHSIFSEADIVANVPACTDATATPHIR